LKWRAETYLVRVRQADQNDAASCNVQVADEASLW